VDRGGNARFCAGIQGASREPQLFQNVREAPLEDVGPVSRNSGVGIFNDSEEEGSARERVVRILRGFRFDNAIPPVEIIEGQTGYPYRYKLVHGAHRFYCSLAAGFKCVPCIEGFDRGERVPT